MMHSPFDSRFDLPMVVPVQPQARPLGLRVLAVIVVPAAIALAVAYPALAHARVKPSDGFAPAMPQAAPARPADGSIFNASNGYAALVEGRRAHAVGDPLTIVLVESLTTSKSAAGKKQKNGSFSFTPPTAGPLSFINPNALNPSGSASFNGQGNASQTSTLGGQVSVTIAEVRPNGTALVKGEKRLLLSQGQEWVQFSGIVRLGDIDADNSIVSTRVADARIEYAGNGTITSASREGWLGRFFNAINPF